MRTLYFDLDGTILSSKDGHAKENLRDGALEQAIRRARFTNLVCVGNIGIVTNAVADLGIDYDPIEVVFRICEGIFQDINWFRAMTVMVPAPEKRGEFIDLSSDWWYMDDLAIDYLRMANRLDILTGNSQHRVFVPNPRGDGSGVLGWLDTIPI